MFSLLLSFNPYHSAKWSSPELGIVTSRSQWFTLCLNDLPTTAAQGHGAAYPLTPQRRPSLANIPCPSEAAGHRSFWALLYCSHIGWLQGPWTDQDFIHTSPSGKLSSSFTSSSPLTLPVHLLLILRSCSNKYSLTSPPQMRSFCFFHSTYPNLWIQFYLWAYLLDNEQWGNGG